MATPRYQPTDKDRRTVQMMAAFGQPHDHILTVLGVSRPTLKKYFRTELDRAAIEANTRVLGGLYKNAMNGSIIAQMFWAKCRCGWSENPDDAPGGEGGMPLHLTVTFRRPVAATIDAVVVPDAG